MATVSVIVPVYNVEKYIGQLIESLTGQTLKDIEIILVDDGSKDNSGKICDEYAKKDGRIQVIHKANGGVGSARNMGLEAAQGKWVIFCDADDWLELDALEALVNAAEENNADVAFGDANLAYKNLIKENPLYKAPFATSDREVIDKLIAASMSRNYCFAPPECGPGNGGYGGPWNKLVKRQLLMDNHICFDTRVKGEFDDILYVAHIFACAKKVVYIKQPVYNYRQLENSIAHSKAYKKELLNIDTAIFNSWNEFLSKYGADGRYLKPYYANVIRRFKNLLGRYFFNKDNTTPLRQQFKELKAVMDREPYAAAIMGAEYNKLHNSYDKSVWIAARTGMPLAVYVVYRLSIIAKDIRSVRRK